MENINDILESGLLELYVLGETNAEETLQVEQWIQQHPEVKAELQAIEISLEAIAIQNAVVPNSTVKEKLWSQLAINEHKETTTSATIIPFKEKAKKAKASSVWQMAAAACGILFIASAAYNVVQQNNYKQAQKELQQKEQELLALQNDTKQMNDVVFSSYSQPIDLKGLPASPNSNAKIFWMKNTGDVYINPNGLPTTPQGKQYQLWAIVEGKPVDAGMVSYSKDGKRIIIQKMKTFSNVKVEAFAITLEVTGGKQQPEGDMYVMAKI